MFELESCLLVRASQHIGQLLKDVADYSFSQVHRDVGLHGHHFELNTCELPFRLLNDLVIAFFVCQAIGLGQLRFPKAFLKFELASLEELWRRQELNLVIASAEEPNNACVNCFAVINGLDNRFFKCAPDPLTAGDVVEQDLLALASDFLV